MRLKEGSKQGGERQEMYGQERGRGGCLQGDREEGGRWGGAGLGVRNVHWPGGGQDEPDHWGSLQTKAAPTLLAGVRSLFPAPAGTGRGDRSAGML